VGQLGARTLTEQPPKGRPVRSVVVIAASQAVKVGSAIVSAAVLARFLTPGDFGLVATVSPLMILAMMLQDMGFTQAVVQRQEITRGQINTLFWLNVLVAATLAALLVGFSPVIAAFFGDGRLAAITWGSATFLMLWALTAQPLALLNRDLRFSAIAWVEIGNSVVMLIVGIAVAALTRSYWAILVAQIAGALFGLVLATSLTRWRPGAPDFDEGVRELVRFGAGLSTFNILNYISRNADNFLLARFAGQIQLGLYDRAYKLMLTPIMQVNAPISRVLLPLLSRLQNDEAEYRKSYAYTVTGLMAALHPGLLTAVVFSASFVRILLGPGWSEVAPIFAWLGLATLHQVLTNTLGWLMVSQGRARPLVVLGAYSCVTTVAAFIVGLPYGALGVAAAYVITDYVLRLPVAWWIATRNGPVSLADLLRAALPHVLAAAVTGAALLGVARLMPAPGVVELALLTVAAYAVYLGLLLLFPGKRALAGIVRDKGVAFLKRRRMRLA